MEHALLLPGASSRVFERALTIDQSLAAEATTCMSLMFDVVLTSEEFGEYRPESAWLPDET